MSGKNRVFALAVATAALVGFCAPMASAATVQGPSNSGFNNDSVLNLSNNQIPTQLCTFGAATNLAPVIQAVTGTLAGTASQGTGDVTAGQSNTCSQSSSQTNTSTTDVTPATTGSTDTYTWNPCRCGGGTWTHTGSDPSTDNSGFNNDSVLNLSNNQIPSQVCTFGALTNAAAIVQALAPIVPVLSTAGLTQGTGAVTAGQASGCSQASTQSNTSSTTAG